MSYCAPELKQIMVTVTINTNASEIGSCEGGHCVRTRYGQDH